MTPKRHARCQAKKRRSHLEGLGNRKAKQGTTQDGNIKLIHFHLTILSSILLFWVFLIAFLRFSSLLTKYFNVIQVERRVKKQKKRFESTTGTQRRTFLGSSFHRICTECVTILDGFPTIRKNRLLLDACFRRKRSEKQRSENREEIAHMYDEFWIPKKSIT